MRKAFFQKIQCFKGETMRHCCPATKNSSRLFSLILFQRIPILKITVLVPGRMVLSCLRSLQAHKQWNLLLWSQPTNWAHIQACSCDTYAKPMRNSWENFAGPWRTSRRGAPRPLHAAHASSLLGWRGQCAQSEGKHSETVRRFLVSRNLILGSQRYCFVRRFFLAKEKSLPK